ncbi:MAG TPA: FkbM family methyltransferase [Terracidiphilus sp.]|nr:FkbM family methyltransferase [Terracidiphilus sp.]
MNLLASLTRPEYIFRPAQIVRRVKCQFKPSTAHYETVCLPWGLPIRVEPKEELGALIRRLGVYDLHACEYISRLVDPGDFAVDVGANIGQMTSLMAVRAGPSGEVWAIEPHPVPFAELEYNTTVWNQDSGSAPIRAHRSALSDHSGVAKLVVPLSSGGNHMLAFLADGSRASSPDEHYEVQLRSLDELVGERRGIDFLKVDVEGHERQVLEGSRRLLASGRVRDILFEELQTPPTSVTKFLESVGFAVFRAAGTVSGPTPRAIDSAADSLVHGPPNFIATRDSQRFLRRMAGRGWTALRNCGHAHHPAGGKAVL